MPTAQQGSIRLFRFAGVDLFLHWSWFLVAAFEISGRSGSYSSLSWNVLEYLSLFFIVMLHEFGHALACRQVGGRANEIVLWPLGGIAFVSPPPRPAAWLWSIAAGPLVNLLLVPVTVAAWLLARTRPDTGPDVDRFLEVALLMNLALLIFNLLPIYPLDGGQILQALLWFVLGRPASLTVASAVGLVGAVGIVAWAVAAGSIWLGVVAAFAALRCLAGFQQ